MSPFPGLQAKILAMFLLGECAFMYVIAPQWLGIAQPDLTPLLRLHLLAGW